MKIFREIEKYIELSDVEKKIIILSLKLRKVKKGDIVLKQNESSNFLGFIDKGILRSYAKDESNNDITWHFFEQGSFFSDLYSFDLFEKSKVTIEALSDSEIYTFDKNTFNYLENNINSWSSFALQYYQLKSSCLLNFNAKIKSMSAIDSYNLFSKYYKQAIKESPKKHIASFLGMSKYTISRIRLH